MDPLNGKRILVVEDEPLIAIVLADILQDAGCIVVGPAYDTRQALECISLNSIDAAVLDVNLGSGQTSAPVADVLNERDIPYIFATGYGASALRFEDRDKLRVDKPYDAHKICETLRKCM
ncbi:MAG: response regulator [Hyphomicrobium zavarzinii]|jgi:CheY-like chemotaxis protein|uniref:response regulator n=1 Tax=Hyphomicrobium TaxID=81 RepID=UPI0003786C39|nr:MULTISPECIES: response regulator [Hyphomicrobium]MBL8846222.1 response regulator [Hyphomicrobium zavarzinii]WBT38438.1 response regulator [Hyphomicrobium sp. DMF-1]